jgi:hypothetical protein
MVRYQGQPAWLVAYRDAADPAVADVLVVPSGCFGSDTVPSTSPLGDAAATTAPLLRTRVTIP